MIYRFEVDGKMCKFDTDGAALLMSDRYCNSLDKREFSELYESRWGAYVRVFHSFDSGRTFVAVVEKEKALAMLAMADPRQRTWRGERLLNEHDPCHEI